MSALGIIGGRERRRRWSVEDKVRIVGETHEPGACVRAVAARHDVYPSLLHDWRRQVREGWLGTVEALRFVPVRVTEAPLSPSAVGAASVPKNRRGVVGGKRGDLLKILWHDGLGMSVYAKRLEHGRFIRPSATDGVVAITAAQLAYMLEGIDWRHPQRTWRPELAG